MAASSFPASLLLVGALLGAAHAGPVSRTSRLSFDFDPAAARGSLLLEPDDEPAVIVHDVEGCHPLDLLPVDLDGTEGWLVLWESHPAGGEVRPELWIEDSEVGAARAGPEGDDEVTWHDPTYGLDLDELQVERTVPGEDGWESAIRIQERYALSTDGLHLVAHGAGGPLDASAPPDPAAAPTADLPDDPAGLTPGQALTALRGLGFFRPVVSASLKRKYSSYVRTSPRPPEVPAEVFGHYQMALLALAQGSGGPDQSKVAANRSAYFAAGRAFDLEAKVYGWGHKPKTTLRAALLAEAQRRAAAVQAHSEVPTVGRYASLDLYRACTLAAAEALRSDLIGLPWGLKEKLVLIDSLMQQESDRIHWQDFALTVSSAGAIGLGQLMPFNREYHPQWNEYLPGENALALASDLSRWIQEAKTPRTAASRQASKRYPKTPMGRLEFALAMYNGGYATTAFAREHYAPSILRMWRQGGPTDPVPYP